MPQFPTSQTLFLAALLCAMAMLSACRPAGETVAEAAIERTSGENVDLERDGDAPGVRSDNGDLPAPADRASVPLPAGFPDDVFLPSQSTVSSAMDMGGTQAVNIATSASLAQVSAEVASTMQARGWKREMSMQTAADSATLIYTKDKRQVVYQLQQAEAGGTRVAVRIGSDG